MAAERLAIPTQATVASSNRSPIIIRRLSSWQELESVRSQWDQLLLHCSSPSIFSTPEWLGAWWRAFGNQKETVCLTFSDPNAELVGIGALYFDLVETPWYTKLSRLRFVGDGTHDSDNLDCLFKRGYEETCAQALVDWLSSENNWDICELNTLPSNSVALPFLLTALSEHNWVHQTLETPCSSVPLADSWEEYLETISKKEKSKIAYLSKRLEKKFQTDYTKCEHISRLPAALDTLFDLHQKHWVQRGLTGSFACAERRAFYADMAASFLERGWLELWQMALNGRPVATQFAFRFGKTVYCLQEGFDPEYGPDSVGYVLRAHVLKQIISEGVRRYDFLGGKDPSKDRWGAVQGHYVDLHFARPRSSGALLLKSDELERSAKSWFKANLPASTLKVITGIYHAVRFRRTYASAAKK